MISLTHPNVLQVFAVGVNGTPAAIFSPAVFDFRSCKSGQVETMNELLECCRRSVICLINIAGMSQADVAGSYLLWSVLLQPVPTELWILVGY